MKEMESQAKLSLKLQAYQYLKTKILNCEYRPNEFLNEQKLCAEMGNISRTPMRDALGRLEQEGLITILPKKGLMVSGITEEDVHSMFEMRLLVEPYALRTYGSEIPQEELAAFTELMHNPDRIDDFCKADDDFHVPIGCAGLLGTPFASQSLLIGFFMLKVRPIFRDYNMQTTPLCRNSDKEGRFAYWKDRARRDILTTNVANRRRPL